MAEEPLRPNAGRIYDYLLGGHHNFEVDRQMAEQLKQMLPSLPVIARLQRWCLRDIAEELTRKRGFDILVDFASGLPTQDHLHEVVSRDVTVIYSDSDPLVVEYAQDILKDYPNAHYFQADARKPEDLLTRPEVEEILQGRRDVGIVFWGVAAFLPDEDLQHALQYLYEWSAPEAVLAFDAQGADFRVDVPEMQQVMEKYRQMGSPLHARSLARYEELIRPWQVDGRFIPLLEWHGVDASVLSEKDREYLGAGGVGYGGYLVHGKEA